MPTYCYSTPAGQVVERIFPMGKAPPSIHLGSDLVAKRDYQAERVAVPATAGWPMEPCYASGVHAEQAGELRDHLRDRGVPTEVTSGGDPIYRSAAHRTKALAVRGLHDNNSFS